jgi:hypothetical protein
MDPRDRAEFIEEKTVHAPFDRNDLAEFVVKILHLPLNEPESFFCILKDGVFGVAVLLLVLLQDDLVDGLTEFPPVVLAEHLDDLGSVAHHVPRGRTGAVLVGLEVLDNHFE